MICNHCGKQIEQTENKSINVSNNGKWLKANLCDDCYVKILYIIKQFCIGEDEDTMNWLYSDLDELIDMEY